MQWNNEIQKAILQEWTEGCRKVRTPRNLISLRRKIAKKYGLTVYYVQGIIELGAVQGLNRREEEGETKGPRRRYEPINYHELIGDLNQRVATLERRFNYLLEGIDRVIEDGETIRVHVQQLRGIAQWARKRDAIDLEGKPSLAIPGRK